MSVIFKREEGFREEDCYQVRNYFVYFPQISNMIIHTYYIRIKEHVNHQRDYISESMNKLNNNYKAVDFLKFYYSSADKLHRIKEPHF